MVCELMAAVWREELVPTEMESLIVITNRRLAHCSVGTRNQTAGTFDADLVEDILE